MRRLIELIDITRFYIAVCIDYRFGRDVGRDDWKGDE